MEPWVFRSVLDEHPRMITLALDKELFVAYHTQTCAMYKAWKGDVMLDGAVYTTYHGPQPSSLGSDYFINEIEDPWKVYVDGASMTGNMQYSGHRFDKGEVCLMYRLQVDDDRYIDIEEKSMFRKTGAGFPVFEREFNIVSNPSGLMVGIMINYSSLMNEESLITNGSWKEYEASAEGTIGELVLNLNGPTSLKAFLSEPVFANLNEIIEEDLPEAVKIMNANDCRSCHNEKIMTVGPSYEAVAKKYPNTLANRQMLKSKIRNGGQGVWGGTAMTAHPEIPDAELEQMVAYIMELDAEEESIKQSLLNSDPINAAELMKCGSVLGIDLVPGAYAEVHHFEGNKNFLSELDLESPTNEVDVLPFVDMVAQEFGPLQEKFAIVITGFLKIDYDQRLVLRIASDDGSKLYLHDKLVIDNDGLHGTQARDANLAMQAGYHPFKIEFFENGGGQSLFFQWRTAQTGEFVTIPSTHLFRDGATKVEAGNIFQTTAENPGDQSPLVDVHPSYDLTQARPDNFEPKVAGLDFLSDGRAVISTWDALGGVYLISNVASGDPKKMRAKRIASGLAEPLGLKVVNDVIYVMQKQEMTRLVDNNGDDYIDEYQVLSNDWDVTANFHEFGFGLDEKDGHLYATLATGIQPGGASALNQPKDRGSVVKVALADGRTELIANGLRTPNGIGVGVDNEVFVADNEGDWLPSCKILHVSDGAWFGSRSVDFEGTAGLTEKKPVVWLPHNEIGNSPSTPTYINDGPYKGQMIHGEVTHGGIKRVFVEKVGGEYQGCVFRFMQGLEAGVNRLRWGPDGALYAGGIGSTGNWQQDRKLWYGLQRLDYNGQSTFEMLAVRAKSNGIELEFTEPLAEASGNHPINYDIKQWWYLPTENYGGPKMDEENLTIRTVTVSKDRRKVFLELDGMKADHVIYVHLYNPFLSSKEQKLWTTEAWYTMNQIPGDDPGMKGAIVSGVNELTAEEKAEGWQLLFDGKTTKGWRNFNQDTIGKSWQVIDGELTLVTIKDNGAWKATHGGDIITDKRYQDFELSLEWKISDCGNSGIMFNVQDGEDYWAPWQSGPEMQVLDNRCHPDADIKTHRAGDLYDMISCSEELFSGANEWQQARLISKDGKVEHWLNGKKLVEYTMHTAEWRTMKSKSKFADMKAFGAFKEGHIALQDHSDRVAFRNIKVREL